MAVPKRILRFLLSFLFLSILLFVFYANTYTRSSLTEDANPENAKDQNGNTKEPDLAPGVAQVIDSHRGQGRADFDFPGIVHQTAVKSAPTPATLSWYYANVGEEHRFYDNKEALAYVKDNASPEIYATYKALDDPVARADLFRYVVLYASGGVYADIDTTTLCQVNAWIPTTFDVTSIRLVIGIEVDEPSVTDAESLAEWRWAANFSFVQWTILAKPRHKAVHLVIQEALRRVEALADERAVTVGNLDMTPLDIIRTTGPGAFTAAVLQYLDLTEPTSLRGLTAPVQIKDVLIMPVSTFAPNQRHSKSKSVTQVENIPEIMVMHGFQGSRSWADEIKNWLRLKVY